MPQSTLGPGEIRPDEKPKPPGKDAPTRPREFVDPWTKSAGEFTKTIAAMTQFGQGTLEGFPNFVVSGKDFLFVAVDAVTSELAKIAHEGEPANKKAADKAILKSDKKPEVTYQANEIYDNVGTEASTGVDMLKAKKVTIRRDGDRVHIEMDRKGAEPLKTVYDLVFIGDKFSFDITRPKDKNGVPEVKVLNLTNVEGLSILIPIKEKNEGKNEKKEPIAISSVEISLTNNGFTTTITLHSAKDGSKRIDLILPATFNGFAQFEKAGRELKPKEK